jgi:hypothetical protein
VIYVLIAVLAALMLGSALTAVGRKPKGDEVERFHRARQMTTAWSQRYAATGSLDLPRPAAPPVPESTPVPDREREPEPAQRG